MELEQENKLIQAFLRSEEMQHSPVAACAASSPLLTSFSKETNPREFQSVEHVDKGLIKICSNPMDLEVYVKG